MNEQFFLDLSPVIATTHIVRQTILTVEALNSAAAIINNSDRKPTMSIEHDRLSPPMGQTVSSKVVPLGDGHHALVGVYDVFDAPETIVLPCGEVGLLQRSKSNTFAFNTAQFRHATTFAIGADPTNLGGILGTNAFFEELRANERSDFDTFPFERRSAIPDPELIITLGLQVSASWFGVRIAKVAADSVEQELKALFAVLIRSVKRFAESALPSHRPITYVYQVAGHPNLEFVARTRDAHAVISALLNDDISDLKPQIEKSEKQFGAEMIQFKLNDSGKWKFSYLLTRDGKVIGTRESFDHRAVVLTKMEIEKRKQLQRKYKRNK